MSISTPGSSWRSEYYLELECNYPLDIDNS